MTGSADEFLPGEKVLATKSANAVIKLGDLHLSALPVEHLMPLLNMRGKEAIGGKLQLTNYRLLFVSHAANRVTGKFSVLLPTIQCLRDASRFFAKKLEVQTATQTFEFVVWGVPQLIAQIEGTKAALTQDDALRIARLVLQSAQVPGLRAADAQAGARDWLAAAQQDDHRSDNPFELASLLNASELISSLAR
jgi:hypothetical protein